jgi:hypothetical protein
MKSKARTILGQFLLQLEAVHLGHAHVGHETAGFGRAAGGEKLARAGEEFRLDILRLEQEAQRFAHAGVVVDDVDLGRLRHWVSLRPASAAA